MCALSENPAVIPPSLADIEIDELVLYGAVAERLCRAGLTYCTAYAPHASRRIRTGRMLKNHVESACAYGDMPTPSMGAPHSGQRPSRMRFLRM